jgi:hypothetical protein
MKGGLFAIAFKGYKKQKGGHQPPFVLILPEFPFARTPKGVSM